MSPSPTDAHQQDEPPNKKPQIGRREIGARLASAGRHPSPDPTTKEIRDEPTHRADSRAVAPGTARINANPPNSTPTTATDRSFTSAVATL